MNEWQVRAGKKRKLSPVEMAFSSGWELFTLPSYDISESVCVVCQVINIKFKKDKEGNKKRCFIKDV